MAAQTLEQFLGAHGESGPLQASVAEVLTSLATGAVELRDIVALGPLGAAFAGQKGSVNAGGDAQKELDVVADEIFLNAVHGANVAVYASEELDNPIVLSRGAPLAVALDPLDGSSNIDTNVSIGTIFAVLPVVGDPEFDPLKSFLQPGRQQVAAGFFIYGPQLVLVLTVGSGTHIFVYSERQKSFVQAFADVALPAKTSEFAINTANYRHWDEPIRHYVDECLKGSEGARGRDFNMRWIASLVADTYRILARGGVFLYPGDSRKGYGKGRLRLVYEANPIALLIEQAGGRATNTVSPILDLIPEALHERTPLVFGSISEVEQVGRYHDDPAPVGIRSPLFGQRGLFRS